MSLDLNSDEKVSEGEFVAGYDRELSAALLPEWAADLPEGALDEYESRGAAIPAGEHRAIRVQRSHQLAAD